jgi:phospholipid/cholesterol/gamma-HCH transport system substrate-binding protein
MTSARVNLTAVGAFVLLALATLIVALAVLAGRTGATDRYYTVYTNVTGLKFGSQVFYEGFPIGQIERIEPQAQGSQMAFRVELSVTRGWKIPKDSIASTTATGLLAPQIVAISAGKSAEALKPGEQITPGSSADLFSTMAGAAGNLDKLSNEALLPLLDNINRQVNAIGSLLDQDTRRLIQNVDTVVAATGQDLPAILQDVRRTTGDLAAVSNEARGALSPERMVRIGRAIDNVDIAMQNLSKVSVQVEALTSGSGQDLKLAARELRMTAENFSRHSAAIAENLDAATRNMQEFSRQIRANPGLLLRGGAVAEDRDAASAVQP